MVIKCSSPPQNVGKIREILGNSRRYYLFESGKGKAARRRSNLLDWIDGRAAKASPVVSERLPIGPFGGWGKRRRPMSTSVNASKHGCQQGVLHRQEISVEHPASTAYQSGKIISALKPSIKPVWPFRRANDRHGCFLQTALKQVPAGGRARRLSARHAQPADRPVAVAATRSGALNIPA